MKKILSLLLVLALLLSFSACSVPNTEGTIPSTLPAQPVTESTQSSQVPADSTQDTEALLDEHGHYNSKEDVALYIHLYGKLPENYVTKAQCKALGVSTGHVSEVVEDGAIGGDTFGNREGLLPKKAGRTWTECDIDTWGRTTRGAKRIVFSNDGLVYYTSDHYNSFELLYGEP